MVDNSKLKMDISIKDTDQFKFILKVLGKIITDERIDEEVRLSYFNEIIENIG